MEPSPAWWFSFGCPFPQKKTRNKNPAKHTPPFPSFKGHVSQRMYRELCHALCALHHPQKEKIKDNQRHTKWKMARPGPLEVCIGHWATKLARDGWLCLCMASVVRTDRALLLVTAQDLLIWAALCRMPNLRESCPRAWLLTPKAPTSHSQASRPLCSFFPTIFGRCLYGRVFFWGTCFGGFKGKPRG